MLVIVEGPDGSGKTTLVNKLRRELEDYAWMLRSNSKVNNFPEMDNALGWIERKPPSIVLILDRHPLISERVYGPLLRGVCMHDLDAEWIAKYIGEYDYPVMTIYCRPTADVMRVGVAREDQRSGIRKNFEQIITEYDTLMREMDKFISIVEYNWTDPRSVITQRVQEFINGPKTVVPILPG